MALKTHPSKSKFIVLLIVADLSRVFTQLKMDSSETDPNPRGKPLAAVGLNFLNTVDWQKNRSLLEAELLIYSLPPRFEMRQRLGLGINRYSLRGKVHEFLVLGSLRVVPVANLAG